MDKTTSKHINLIENSILITVGIAVFFISLFVVYLVVQENFVDVFEENNDWIRKVDKVCNSKMVEKYQYRACMMDGILGSKGWDYESNSPSARKKNE